MMTQYLVEDTPSFQCDEISIVAHEFINHLTSMRLALHMVKLNYHELEPLELVARLNHIAETVDMMSSLATRFLEAKKMAQSEVCHTSFDLRILIDTALIQYEPYASSKGITLRVNSMADKLLLHTDFQMVYEVLSNLLSNAIKFSPTSTTININATYDNNRIHLAVEDEGPGLSEKDKENLFVNFMPLSAKPTANEHSSGLGLLIVKKFVTLLGGDVWAESLGKGCGTTFKISLPSTLA